MKNRIGATELSSSSSSPSRTRLKNVTNVLAQLLDDYDIRLRPDFGGKLLTTASLLT